MSFGAFRSALRLYRPRIVPKSRAARYGLAATVAAGAGIAYMVRIMEKSVWSDEFKPDPPLPPKYERKYRLGAQYIALDMSNEAWETLAPVWQAAFDDGADAAVLAAIAAKMLLADGGAPPGDEHVVVTHTLHRLLRAGWDDVLPRERERAIWLAAVAAIIDEDIIDKDTLSPPFIQWAWAQAWHLAVQDALQSVLPVAELVDLASGGSVLPKLPLALVIAEQFEQRRRDSGLEPTQQCMLASMYTSLAFAFMSADPAQDAVAHRYHRRALAVMEPASDPEGTAWGSYLAVMNRMFFHVGMLFEKIGELENAVHMYIQARAGMPDDDPLKPLVHASMLRATLRMQRSAAASNAKSDKT